MLRDIKKKSSSLRYMIIMGLLIIAFAFWGISGSLLTSSNDSAATVNGEKISINDFNQANQAAKNRMQSQFGDALGSEYFETENFKRGVLSQLIDSELLKQEAEKFDYDVAPEKIKEVIESAESLQIDGKFSKEAYANYLKTVGKSAQLLQRDIKSDLMGSAVPQLVVQTAFTLESEVNQQITLSKQTRSFNHLEISAADFTDKIEVTDEEINNHYTEFGQDYMTQEQVSVNYIELSISDLVDLAEVNEEDIAAYYESKKQTLMNPEKRMAQHILLPVEDNAEQVKVEIEKLAERIKNGEEFSVVAKEASKDPGSAENGGDLGWVAKGDMVVDFEEALFALELGQVSEPVLSEFGFHLIKLNEIKQAEIASLEEMKETLITELKQTQAEEAFLSKANELEEAVIDSDNILEVAADTVGLKLKSTELFARNGGTGIASNPNFSKEAFSELVINEAQNSNMIDLGENHIAYLHLKEHVPAKQKDLEEVKETIISIIKSNKSKDLAKSKTEEFINKINSGEATLADVAVELEKEVVESIDIARTGSTLPFNLVKNVFTLKLDNEAPKVELVEASSNSFALVQLNSVVLADVSSIEEAEKATQVTQMERGISNNEIINVTAELKSEASITINQAIFEDANQLY
jgi:peptidyl-prolyl cis-trans isomerase D